MLLANLHYIVHWPDGGGYNFVSGPIADITLVTAFVATLLLWWRKHNCHVHGCWRLEWHVHPEHGHPVCKHHHPHWRHVHAGGLDKDVIGSVSTRHTAASARATKRSSGTSASSPTSRASSRKA